MHKTSVVFVLTSLILICLGCDSKPAQQPLVPPKAAKAPDFTLKDLTGKDVKLSELIGSKPLVLDFWSSWCLECTAKLPKLVEIYNDSNKKFNLVGINLDRSAAEAASYVQQNNITIMNLYDEDNKVSNLYGVNSVPNVIIINPQGEIIKTNASLDDVKSLK